jgi:hypothetical protein
LASALVSLIVSAKKGTPATVIFRAARQENEFVFAYVTDIAVSPYDHSPIRSFRTRECFKQCGLARFSKTENAKDLTLVDVKRNVFKDPIIAVTLKEIFDAKRHK